MIFQPHIARYISILTIVLLSFHLTNAKEPQKSKQKVTTTKKVQTKANTKVKTSTKHKLNSKTKQPTPIIKEIGEDFSSKKLDDIPTLEGKLEYISNDKNWKGSKVGIGVYSLTDKELVFSKNYKQQVTPASLTKLFTTFAALEHFGPNYVVPTEVYVDKLPENGVVKGNLYVYGTGDPKLSFQNIEALAEKIQQKGVKKIDGFICADGSYFDKQTQRSLYSGDNEEVQATPSIKALCLDNPSVSVVVSNGSSPSKISYSTIPPSSNFSVITPKTSIATEKVTKEVKSTTVTPMVVPTSQKSSSTTTFSTKKTSKVVATSPIKKATVQSKLKPSTPSKKPIVFPKKQTKPKKGVPKKTSTTKKISNLENDYSNSFGDYILPTSTIKFEKRNPKKGKKSKAVSRAGISVQETTKGIMQIFTINGSVPANKTITKSFPIRNVDATIAGILHNRLESGSVSITGNIDIKQKGNSAVLLTSFVRPFSEIINIVNKNSNNYYAEQVFKMIGGSRDTEVNTAKNSRTIIKKILEKNGIHNVDLNDGSGLSRRNLITAEAMITMLIVAKTKKFFKEYYNSMTIAGVDGTTRSRMKGTCAEGNCHAKTGTLRNASGLAGYVTSIEGKEYVFAIISNGNNVGAYKRLENAMVQTIANYKSSK